MTSSICWHWTPLIRTATSLQPLQLLVVWLAVRGAHRRRCMRRIDLLLCIQACGSLTNRLLTKQPSLWAVSGSSCRRGECTTHISFPHEWVLLSTLRHCEVNQEMTAVGNASVRTEKRKTSVEPAGNNDFLLFKLKMEQKVEALWSASLSGFCAQLWNHSAWNELRKQMLTRQSLEEQRNGSAAGSRQTCTPLFTAGGQHMAGSHQFCAF